jgi:hypothetical protein
MLLVVKGIVVVTDDGQNFYAGCTVDNPIHNLYSYSNMQSLIVRDKNTKIVAVYNSWKYWSEAEQEEDDTIMDKIVESTYLVLELRNVLQKIRVLLEDAKS